MSAFQRIGVSRQQNSVSVAEADHHFKKSCTICTTHGFCGSCDSCPVAAAHRFTVETFEILASVMRERRAAASAR